MEHQQPPGDVGPAVGADSDQLVVGGGVVDLGERDGVGEDAEQLVGIGHDVGGIEEMVVGQVTDRAAVAR